jgi:hypothetical protein
MAPDRVVEVASSRRGLDVRRITPGEENGTTEHKANDLAQAQGHGAGDGTPQLLTVICAADNLSIVARLGREGQALRGL